MSEKKVFILSGPAWAGKNTVWDHIAQTCNDTIEESISVTTRPIRVGEIDGKHYHFISEEEFKKKIEVGDLIEYAVTHTFYYWSTYSELDRINQSGKSPIYIIDVKWMKNLKSLLENKWYTVVTIFLLPPSIEEMKRRLRNRGTESEEQFQIRLATAMTEFEQQDFYDIRIVNDDLEKTTQELLAILRM